MTLTNVRVTDPLAPDCNRTSAQIPALASMAPGASLTYTCSLANVTASFTNVATDTGTPPTGPDVSATDTAHVTVRLRRRPGTPHISVTSSRRISPSWRRRLERHVDDPRHERRPGHADRRRPRRREGARVQPHEGGHPGAGLDGRRRERHLQVHQVRDPAFKSPNVVVATGKPPTGPSVTDSDTARVHAALKPINPRITIAKCPAEGPANCIKSVNGVPKDTQSVIKDGTAAFRITVRNTGDVTLTNVTVTDPWAPECDRNLGTMAASLVEELHVHRPSVTDDHVNTAAVVGTSPRGNKVRDSDVSKVTWSSRRRRRSPSPSARSTRTTRASSGPWRSPRPADLNVTAAAAQRGAQGRHGGVPDHGHQHGARPCTT